MAEEKKKVWFDFDNFNYVQVYERPNGAKVYIDTSDAAKTPEEREKVIKEIKKAMIKAFEHRIMLDGS